MSEDIQEQLSALMDGELPREQTRFLLKRVEHDAALTGRWSRYHVVRYAIRRQDVAPVGEAFALRVMAAIEAEALPMAATGTAGRWLRWGSGGAIAAAVAVAALVSTRPGGEPSVGGSSIVSATSNPVLTTPATAFVAGGSDFRPPLLSVPAQPATASTSTLAQPASFDPRLESYLVRHYEATRASGQSGFAPYVLLVVPSRQASLPTQSESAGERR